MTKESNPLAARVGENIGQLQKARGWKQEALALEVGYGSRSAIASIENGFVLPSLDKALQIAQVLGVPLAALIEERADHQRIKPAV